MHLDLKSCTLRDWQQSDAESLVRYANDRQVWLTLRNRFPHPYTRADADEFLRRTLGAEPRTNFCVDVNGAAVGGIGVLREDGADVHRYTAEFGYWLGREFWGRGIMTEVVRAFSDWALEAFELQRLAAYVFSSNPASARILEKCGFVLEGRLRRNVFKAGEHLDSLVYAKVR